MNLRPLRTRATGPGSTRLETDFPDSCPPSTDSLNTSVYALENNEDLLQLCSIHPRPHQILRLNDIIKKLAYMFMFNCLPTRNLQHVDPTIK